MELKSKQYAKRSAILTCLRNTDTHPSAESVHQMLQKEHPDLSVTQMDSMEGTKGSKHLSKNFQTIYDVS